MVLRGKFAINEFLYLLFFTVCGFLLRYYFSTLAYRNIVFDMQAYISLAHQALNGNWIVDCCAKNPGYPLFLALLFVITGGENLDIVRLVQVVADIATGLLFYVTAKTITGKVAAFVFFGLYMLNPFTSAMTGLILPDTISFLYMSLLVFILGREKFTKNPTYWFIAGIILGLLLLTRVQFLYLSIALILIYALISQRKIFLFMLITVSGFLIPSIYSFIGNYQVYGRLTFLPPYTFQAGHLYLMFYQIKPYPEVVYEGEHEEERRVWMEYALTSLEDKKAFSDKYTVLFWQKLQNEWPLFFYNWSRKAWWIWDKDHIFIYHDPFHPADRWPLRILNIGLILGFFFGIWKYSKVNGKKVFKNHVFILTVILFLQITILYSLVSSEARHSLIFYPFLILWTAWGIASKLKLRGKLRT